jgi:hypothetical protein
MNKNSLPLIVYSRTMKAANDDGSSGPTHSTSTAAMRTPATERSGWDPFEVWRTRIRAAAARDTRRDR